MPLKIGNRIPPKKYVSGRSNRLSSTATISSDRTASYGESEAWSGIRSSANTRPLGRTRYRSGIVRQIAPHRSRWRGVRCRRFAPT